MNPTKSESVVSRESPVETRRDTLTITDNRNGRQYEIPVKSDTIRALDLRPIKIHDSDFGMMSYDPALTNTAIDAVRFRMRRRRAMRSEYS